MDDHVHSIHTNAASSIAKANSILDDPSCLDQDLYELVDCYSELVGVEVYSMELGSSHRNKIFGESF